MVHCPWSVMFAVDAQWSREFAAFDRHEVYARVMTVTSEDMVLTLPLRSSLYCSTTYRSSRHGGTGALNGKIPLS